MREGAREKKGEREGEMGEKRREGERAGKLEERREGEGDRVRGERWRK